MRCIASFNSVITLDGFTYTEKQDELVNIVRSYPSALLSIFFSPDLMTVRTQTPISSCGIRPIPDKERGMGIYVYFHKLFNAALRYGIVGKYISLAAIQLFKLNRYLDRGNRFIQQVLVQHWYNGELINFKGANPINMEYVVPTKYLNDVIKAILDLMKRY
jgi:hypothetical protein